MLKMSQNESITNVPIARVSVTGWNQMQTATFENKYTA